MPGGDFDLAHLKAIHRHLFQDVYAWAGEIRTVEIAKGESRFQPRRFIATGMANIPPHCGGGVFRAWLRFPMAFRYGLSYGFQFEPQLTLDELRVWNRELAGDYELMGACFDPAEEAARNLREFTAYAPLYEPQMARMLRDRAAPLLDPESRVWLAARCGVTFPVIDGCMTCEAGGSGSPASADRAFEVAGGSPAAPSPEWSSPLRMTSAPK